MVKSKRNTKPKPAKLATTNKAAKPSKTPQRSKDLPTVATAANTASIAKPATTNKAAKPSKTPQRSKDLPTVAFAVYTASIAKPATPNKAAKPAKTPQRSKDLPTVATAANTASIANTSDPLTMDDEEASTASAANALETLPPNLTSDPPPTDNDETTLPTAKQKALSTVTTEGVDNTSDPPKTDDEEPAPVMTVPPAGITTNERTTMSNQPGTTASQGVPPPKNAASTAITSTKPTNVKDVKNHTERILKTGISVSAFTAFLPLFKSSEDNKYKPINVRSNWNTLKSDIVYSMTNSIMGNPFRIVLTGQKKDFDNSDLEVFAYRYSKITETKVRFDI